MRLKNIKLIIIITVVSILLLGVFWNSVYKRKVESLPTTTQVAPKKLFTATSSQLYDPTIWQLAREENISLGAYGDINVVLLRSKDTTGETGVGGDLHTANVIIRKDDKLLYQHTKDIKPQKENAFFVDFELDVADMTNDGIPEIIFESGDIGASDYGKVIHILRFNPPKNIFEDIDGNQFIRSGTVSIQRFVENNKTYLVEAKPIWPKDINDPGSCHYCAKFYNYDLYLWDSDRSKFIEVATQKSGGRFSDGSTAINNIIDFSVDNATIRYSPFQNSMQKTSEDEKNILYKGATELSGEFWIGNPFNEIYSKKMTVCFTADSDSWRFIPQFTTEDNSRNVIHQSFCFKNQDKAKQLFNIGTQMEKRLEEWRCSEFRGAATIEINGYIFNKNYETYDQADINDVIEKFTPFFDDNTCPGVG